MFEGGVGEDDVKFSVGEFRHVVGIADADFGSLRFLVEADATPSVLQSGEPEKAIGARDGANFQDRSTDVEGVA